MKAKKLLIFLFVLITLLWVTLSLSACGECEHSFGEWKTITKPTCTEKGLKERVCVSCDHKETEEIPAHFPIAVPAVAPTCTKKGLTEGTKCSECNTVLKEQTVVPVNPDAHTIKVIPGLEPSCTSVGFTEAKKCTECNIYTAERTKIEMLPHTPKEAPGKAPTCTAWGSEDGSVCSVCNAILVMNDPLPPLDHILDDNNVCVNCKIPYVYSDDLDYRLSDDGEYYIVYGRGSCTDTTIIIPDMHLGKPVKEIANAAFYMDGSIGYLKIGNNVTRIGTNAFFSCSGFTYLQIPDSVKYIGALAFDFCTGINILDIGSGLESFDLSTFHRATQIRKIKISPDNKNFKVIDNVIYSNDGKKLLLAARKGAESFTVPDGVEEIAENSFYYSLYKTVTIPSSVKKIGDEAFYRAQIERIIGGEGLEEIGNQAFTSSNLSEITLGSKLKVVGNLAFSATKLTSVKIPASLTVIPESCFFSTPSLKTVVIENGVLKIEGSAFNSTSVLTMTIPDSVEEICASAFSDCGELTSLTLGNGISKINKNAFLGCGKLSSISVSEGNPIYASADGILLSKDKTVLELYPAGKDGFTLPSSVKSLSTSSVQSYKGTEIILPESIEIISTSAFIDCSNLEKIVLGKNISQVNGLSFNGCTKLKAVEVSAENPLFSHIDGILCNKDKSKLLYFPYARESSEIPSSIKTIGSYSFVHSGVKELVIPDTVELIEDNTFNGNEAIKKVTVGKGVTKIGNNAFMFCTSLVYLYIPESVIEMGSKILYFNAYYMEVFCEAEAKPDGWDEDWNYDDCPVTWGYELS